MGYEEHERRDQRAAHLRSLLIWPSGDKGFVFGYETGKRDSIDTILGAAAPSRGGK